MFRYKTPLDLCRGLKQAAGCSDGELARARKRLADPVLGRRLTGAPGVPDAGPAGAAGDDEGPSSTSYPEMLARFATLRRERRTPTPAELNATPTVFQSLPEAFTFAPQPVAAVDLVEGAASGLTQAPGAVLAVAVLGMLYAGLLAVCLLGEAAGLVRMSPAIPADIAPPWTLVTLRIAVALLGILLCGVLVAACSGCFRLRPWARRWMLRYAAADLLLQAIVLACVVAWVGPAIVRAMTAAAPAEGAAVELSVYAGWVLRALALSVFPVTALTVMSRPHVRAAFLARVPPTPAPVAAVAPTEPGAAP